MMTRVLNRERVRRVMRRPKIYCTWSARPMSRFSRMISSNRTLPLTGRSNTCVRAHSGWRIERS